MIRRTNPNHTMDNTIGSSSSSSVDLSLLISKRKRPSKDSRTCRAYETPNFIAKNIRAASRARKIEYDTDDSELSSLRSSIDSGRWCRMGTPAKEPVGATVDLDYSRGNSVELEEKATGLPKQSLRFPDTRGERCSNTSSSDVKTSKYYIKQTTCPACMEKWRKPLPPPKTPKVSNAKVVPTLGTQVVKTDSRVRVKELIHKEKHTLQTYDRKFSSSSESSRRGSLKKEDLTNDPCDFVKLSPLELARIRQENREEETRKKLEKFLNSPI